MALLSPAPCAASVATVIAVTSRTTSAMMTDSMSSLPILAMGFSIQDSHL